jgi:hypothetical protein
VQELWESKNKDEGTPMSKFYTQWRKVKDRQLQQAIAGKTEVRYSCLIFLCSLQKDSLVYDTVKSQDDDTVLI